MNPRCGAHSPSSSPCSSALALSRPRLKAATTRVCPPAAGAKGRTTARCRPRWPRCWQTPHPARRFLPRHPLALHFPDRPPLPQQPHRRWPAQRSACRLCSRIPTRPYRAARLHASASTAPAPAADRRISSWLKRSHSIAIGSSCLIAAEQVFVSVFQACV